MIRAILAPAVAATIGDAQERARTRKNDHQVATRARFHDGSANRSHRRGSTCPPAGLEDESQRRCSSRYHRRNGARNHSEPLIRTALLRTGERGTERDSGYHTKVIPSPGPPCATAGVSAYLRTCLLVPDYLSSDFSTPAPPTSVSRYRIPWPPEAFTWRTPDSHEPARNRPMRSSCLLLNNSNLTAPRSKRRIRIRRR